MINCNQAFSPHFTLAEFVASETAMRLVIVNMPTEIVVNRLRILCDTALEPERVDLEPLHINSGYRSP